MPHKEGMEPESKSTSEAADWVVDRLGLGTNDRQPTFARAAALQRTDFISAIADVAIL